MLQIIDISKEYRTGSLVQRALNHVSLNLRDNEFVAILGPSGSGKTTLLNIIGGLDRYDSGDLVINGISTKQYKDRDWDSYRNHTIGFVFQSYNLIPHQTILSNVELALTISGISRSERRERAIEALEEVGLGDQLHKKPSQMSGGQMQRVAIARALVNDPDILLADEPTGALDSETSIQVMELLKNVAKDRLVVMVTHNPELAEAYATRIVTLKDGVITSDTDPCIIDEEIETEHRNMGKASMSFLTALSLSFNNLKTKLTRTILVSFAGSIGIIGISLILSLSNGANKYIHDIEEETLSEYPVTIQSSAFDFTSMMVAREANREEDEKIEKEKDIHEVPMVNGVFSRTKANDLGSLKKYLEHESRIYDYANAVEYSYNVNPHIFRIDGEGYRQVNPDNTFAALGFGGSSNSILSMAMSTDIFYALPQNKSLYMNQYEVKAGRWPQNHNECVVVTMSSGGVFDFALYALGLKDSEDLDRLVEQFANEEEVTVENTNEQFDYEELVGINFKVVNNADLYQYDENYQIWIDKSDDKKYMRDAIRYAEDLTVVGVVQVKENADIAMLQSGIYYPYELIEHIIEGAKNKDITKQQIDRPNINVFTGKRFDDTETPGFDMDSLFSIDESLLSNAFQFDSDKLNIDESAFSDLSNMDMSTMLSPDEFKMDSSMGSLDISSIVKDINIKMNTDELEPLLNEVFSSFLIYSAKNPSTDYATLPQAFTRYLQDPNTQRVLATEINLIIEEKGGLNITNDDIAEVINYVMEGFPQYAIEHGLTDPSQMNNYIAQYLQSDEGQARLTEGILQLTAKASDIEFTDEDIQRLTAIVASGYEEFAKENQLPELGLMTQAFVEYIGSPQGQGVLMNGVTKVIDTKDLEDQITKSIQKNTSAMSEQMANTIASVMQRVMQQVVTQISTSMQNAMGQLAGNMKDAIRFDAGAFTRAFTMTMDTVDLQELMMTLYSNAQDTYDSNLRKLGYSDLDKPSIISIYPKDFECKNEVIHILDTYNANMEKEDEAKVIRYTDTVGTLMSSVTTIIDTISYVLVAFVAISLVVSSIMIGVITYISVLERKKEIGILRAIGASKRNISEVFNAETFIIGLLAGLIGIGITQLLLIPGNYIIHEVSGNPNINAFLPFSSAVSLVILSVILTLIGGLIPSRKAAKSDPVTALRTE